MFIILSIYLVSLRGLALHKLIRKLNRCCLAVQAPTWSVLKITFLLLALCFTAMLALAFSSKNFVIVGHVFLLITIGTVLFVLLNRSVPIPVWAAPLTDLLFVDE